MEDSGLLFLVLLIQIGKLSSAGISCHFMEGCSQTSVKRHKPASSEGSLDSGAEAGTDFFS